jgi:hypothetical protein
MAGFDYWIWVCREGENEGSHEEETGVGELEGQNLAGVISDETCGNKRW